MIIIKKDGTIDDKPDCQAVIHGNIWTNEVKLKVGQKKEGHRHEFDHLHFLVYGKVKVNIYKDELRQDIIKSQVISGPIWIEVPKEFFHDIECIEESLGYCIQALRDENGIVLETNYSKNL